MAKGLNNASCLVCGSRESPHRHHIDWNHANNAPSNICILCGRCHVVLHQGGYLSVDELAAIRATVDARDPVRLMRTMAAACDSTRPEHREKAAGQLFLF